MTDKVMEQILNIRALGTYNMIDITGVQREAFNLNFHELVIFIQEHRDQYIRFILYGERELGE